MESSPFRFSWTYRVEIHDDSAFVCQRIRLSGVVQGVGFRPLVWRIAKELKLTGWVRNDAKGLEIEACGPANDIDLLIRRLHEDSPPLARIDAITSRPTDSVSVADDFFILDSRGGRAATMIGQDTAICRDCLSDVFDPSGRRWRYAFSNCAHCGPRYTICRGLPYDRERTSLKLFGMCKKCLAEYTRADDRRLHAEGNCCPKCGPQLSLVDAKGKIVAEDPIAGAYKLLLEGRIVAIKGHGGFHLACDARNPAAVALLRKRKHGSSKPFPVMFAGTASATSYVQFSVGEPGLLNLPERPIILLKKRAACDAAMPDVAPDLHWLGVMLPFSPIHYLLFHEAAGRPSGIAWLDEAQDFALVMSGGNPDEEPPAIDNEEARERLAGLADAFLEHDREIVVRCDDSIARSGPGGLQLIRRGRGYTPRAVKLAHSGPSILAVGGPVRNSICVVRGHEAFLSQHIGELTNPASCAFFDSTIAHLLKMLEISPAVVAHDLHRDTHATRFAETMATQRGIPALAVQHHHAHVASVLAEHHVKEPVFALALDGGELGTDGTIWGGELLRVQGAHFDRLGHLTPLDVVGDERNSHTSWRLASSVLHALGRTDEIARRFGAHSDAPALAQDLANGRKSARGTSLGWLTKAAAALLGVNEVAVYSSQASLLLEGLAERHGETSPLAGGWAIKDGNLDLTPCLAAIADQKDAAFGAALLYATIAEGLVEWLCSVSPEGGPVAAGGSSLQNQVLARQVRSRLAERGFHLLEARRVPPNDGGLALGQAWIAQQYLQN